MNSEGKNRKKGTCNRAYYLHAGNGGRSRGGRQPSNREKLLWLLKFHNRIPTLLSTELVAIRAQLETLPRVLPEAFRINSNLLIRALSLDPLLHMVPPMVQPH